MKKVISIVEDEKDLNELVKRYLEREGYEVRSYLTFDEASVHSTDEDVHLWILDIMLGDKSGFDLIDEIRACNPDVPVISISGDGGFQMNSQELATAVLEELPIISCIFNNNNLGMVRQWQKLFYGKRYSMTCLRSGAACRGKCGEVECPTYTPDFMKLADSYGAKGIHITKKEDIEPAFREAMKSTKTPYILEFDIDPEDLVYPMVKPGGTLEDLIMDC